jgi:hypothetical protein
MKTVIPQSKYSFRFLTKENVVTVGTRIGDSAIDLGLYSKWDILQVLS